MKWTLVIVATTVAGCATVQPALNEAHDGNVALAQRLGYNVLTENGETGFCATQAPTGSHIIPPCITEAEWELTHPAVAGGPTTNGSGVIESGRSSLAGTLGY
jgi:hypothetical protein